MKSAALLRLDPSIAISLVAAGVFAAACCTSRVFGRGVMVVVQTAWLYLSNTRG